MSNVVDMFLWKTRRDNKTAFAGLGENPLAGTLVNNPDGSSAGWDKAFGNAAARRQKQKAERDEANRAILSALSKRKPK